MAPTKPRFSIRAYAGKKKPKMSLNVQEDDAFDLLLPTKVSTSHIFESSTEKPGTSQSSIDFEPLAPKLSSDSLRKNVSSSTCQTSSSSSSLSLRAKISKDTSRVQKKKKKVKDSIKVENLALIKNISFSDSERSKSIIEGEQFVSSTPCNKNTLNKYNKVFPIVKVPKKKSSGLSIGENTNELYPSPIRKDLLGQESGSVFDQIHDLSENLINCTEMNVSIKILESNGKSNSKIVSEVDLVNSALYITEDNSGVFIPNVKISEDSERSQEDSNQESSSNIFSGLKSFFDTSNEKSLKNDIPEDFFEEKIEIISPRSNLQSVTEEIFLSDKSMADSENITSAEHNVEKSSPSSDISSKECSEFFSADGKSLNKSDSNTSGGGSLSLAVSNRTGYGDTPSSMDRITIRRRNWRWNQFAETSSPKAEDDSLKLESNMVEEAISRLSVDSDDTHKGSSPCSDRISTGRKKNWHLHRHLDPSSPRENHSLESIQTSLHSFARGTDVERRRIYQRLSRSLPASFKESPPSFYFDRFSLTEADPVRSRKIFARLRDESILHNSLTCSTHSLPSVLEDQDLESSIDEELHTPRTNCHFRKQNFEMSHSNSPLFLGFHSLDVSKSRRTFVIKKFNSDDSSCTSPHTLPSLPEDESDSSCEEDESKRIESGSSSQVESPLMSPSVQGSPSRRSGSRISASNSSEMSLSSRSEDEMGNMLSPRASSPDAAAGSSEEDSGSSPVRRDDQRRRRPSRLTSRRTLGYIAEETELDSFEHMDLPDIKRERFVLMTGKKYRRSIAIIHSLIGEETLMNEHKGRSYIQSVEAVKQMQKDESCHGDSDDSSDMSPDPRRSLSNSTFASRTLSRRDTSVYCINSNPVDVSVVCSQFSNLSILETSRFSLLPHSCQTLPLEFDKSVRTTEAVIFSISGQNCPLNLSELYADGSLDSWKKIGEGVYSEVFKVSRLNQPSSVLKIIPVDGDTIVNGGAQKTLEENLSEVLISCYLSNLRKNEEFFCESYVQLLKVWYLEGAYTDELVELWNDFDVNYGSDNDRPIIFPTDQKYLGLELMNSGQALESYTFYTARQSFSVFKQVVFSLAVAESLYEFEHRDLHWGNILVDKTKSTCLNYRIDGKTYSVATNGVKATIIDYTWSSLTYRSGDDCTRIINDMEQDPDLFIGSGDLQFDIYRQMREDVEQDWSRYQPKTNLRWLFYIADKLICKAKYLRPTTNTHKVGISSLKRILEFIPNCDNSLQVALEVQNYK